MSRCMAKRSLRAKDGLTDFSNMHSQISDATKTMRPWKASANLSRMDCGLKSKQSMHAKKMSSRQPKCKPSIVCVGGAEREIEREREREREREYG